MVCEDQVFESEDKRSRDKKLFPYSQVTDHANGSKVFIDIATHF